MLNYPCDVQGLLGELKTETLKRCRQCRGTSDPSAPSAAAGGADEIDSDHMTSAYVTRGVKSETVVIDYKQ